MDYRQGRLINTQFIASTALKREKKRKKMIVDGIQRNKGKLYGSNHPP
jgi:hypothetical protein